MTQNQGNQGDTPQNNPFSESNYQQPQQGQQGNAGEQTGPVEVDSLEDLIGFQDVGNQQQSLDEVEGGMFNQNQGQNQAAQGGQNTQNQQQFQRGNEQGNGQANQQQQNQQAAQHETDNEKKRYQYWQSQYDKLKDTLEPYMPVIERLQQNPELIGQVMSNEQSQGNQGQNHPQQNQQLEVPEKPEKPQRPEKPTGYDPNEAMTDPTSASAQYEQAMRDYQTQVADYQMEFLEWQDKARQVKEQKAEQERQKRLQQQQAMQQQNQQLQEAAEYVKANYGFDDQQAVEFVQTFSNPESVTLDNLAQLYMLQNGINGNQQQTQGNQQGNNQPSPNFQQAQHAQQRGASPLSNQGGGIQQGQQNQDLSEVLAEAYNSQGVFGPDMYDE